MSEPKIAQSTVVLSRDVAKHLLSSEDTARANWYSWFASIWLSPPPQSNIDKWQAVVDVSRADPASDNDDQSPIAMAWLPVVEAANRLGANVIDAEYSLLFSGVGKAEVFLNASVHLSGFLHEKPLVDIRQRLNQLGIGAVSGIDMGLTEDHLGLLCTAMRELVVSNSPDQADFVRDFLASWSSDLVNEIDLSPRADFYKTVAVLWQEFIAIEIQSFDFE
jgi:TorA maturation chaperone TorD